MEYDERKEWKKIEDYMIDSYFGFSKQRFLEGKDAISKVETKVIKDTLVFLKRDVPRPFESKDILIIPESGLKSVDAYKSLFPEYNYTRLLDVLDEKEYIFKRNGVTLGEIVSILMGRELPQEQVMRTVKEKGLKGGISYGIAGLTGLYGEKDDIERRNERVLTRDEVDVLLTLLLDDLDKRGLIKNRGKLLIALTPTEAKLFYDTILLKLDNYSNIKSIIPFPSKREANEYYELLSTHKVMTLFFPLMSRSRIYKVVYEAISKAVDSGDLPKDFHLTLDFLLNEKVKVTFKKPKITISGNMFKVMVNKISFDMSNNPVFTVRATLYALLFIHAHISRKMSNLRIEVDLIKNRNRKLYQHYLSKMVKLMTDAINYGESVVVGSDQSKFYLFVRSVPSYYMLLREFIYGLDIERVKSLYLALKGVEVTEEPYIVLYNLGAISLVAPHKQGKTRIGRMMEAIIRKRLSEELVKNLHSEEGEERVEEDNVNIKSGSQR